MSIGMTAIKEKRVKLYRSKAIERAEIERLNDIIDPKQSFAVRQMLINKDIDLRFIEQQNEIQGYCHCGYAKTRFGKCMMYPEH